MGRRTEKKIFSFTRSYSVPADVLYYLFFSFHCLMFDFYFIYFMKSRVHSLKLAIERHHAIPANSQVLLVSGGETLESANRVCSYSAGTDENPIFMFSNSLEPRNPPQPWPCIENGNNIIVIKSL